jgi:ppGpp synthetase/RelA/SpoT-type nucleotidyltranferase
MAGHEKDQIETWIRKSCLRDASATGLALKARIDDIIDTVEREVCDGKAERFVARIDASHLTKSESSIIEKMAREWNGRSAPPIAFRDIRRSITDLVRFRIVVNFLSDAATIRRAIELPFDTQAIRQVSPAQKALAEEFGLRKNTFEDTVNTRVAQRRSPERSYKGIFSPRADVTGLSVEVQIQTLLQESWDKKQHVLVYEPRRRGEVVNAEVERDLETMSELLFNVDCTFDRLRADLQERERS